MKENILDLIQKKSESFSKGRKKICAYIIEQIEEAAFMTAASLGKEVGVSESTVVRFATELGYAGYPEMQSELRQFVLVQRKSFAEPQTEETLPDETSAVSRVLFEEAERMTRSARTLAKAAFAPVVKAVSDCGRLYLLGFHYAAPLAVYMGNYMRLLHPNVQVVTSACQTELLEQLMFSGQLDAAVVFDFPSDNEAAVFSSRYLRDKGLKIIGIVDSDTSPIAQFCDHILVADTGRTAFVESLTVPMGIIHGILSALVEQNEAAITERVEEMKFAAAGNFGSGEQVSSVEV